MSPQKKVPNKTNNAFDVMMQRSKANMSSPKTTKITKKGEKRKTPPSSNDNNVEKISEDERRDSAKTTAVPNQNRLSNPKPRSFITQTMISPKKPKRSSTILSQKKGLVGGPDDDPNLDDDDDPYNLQSRFVINQRKLFNKALKEIQQGSKKSCWLWFILPTTPYIVNGIEKGSKLNRYYALRSIENNNNNSNQHNNNHDDAIKAYLQYPTQEFPIILQQQHLFGKKEDKEDKTTIKVNLRKNYLTMTKAILYQMQSNNNSSLQSLFGKIDLPKVKSSLQVFYRVAKKYGNDHNDEIASICGKILYLDQKRSSVKHKW